MDDFMANNSRPSLELLKSLLEALPGMTIEQARRYISDDLTIDEPPSLPFGGIYKGPEGYIELVQTTRRTCPSWKFEVDCTVSDAVGNVMVQARVHGGMSTCRWSMVVMERYRFDEDRLVELVVCWHDPKRAAELLAGELSGVEHD
jgi:hypothetical protein